jgi:hypothetical protein
MAYRHKGEYVRPTKTLELMGQHGPTRAAQMLGVSTSRLHKARREMKVSKIVEVAANALLKGPATRAELLSSEVAPVASEPRGLPLEQVSFAPTPAAQQRHQDETMFLISVPTEKAELVKRFAEMLDAECLSA